MKQQKEKSNAYYFFLLIFISFVFRLALILIFRFDGLYGQDAYAYLEFSKRFYESIIHFRIPPNFYWPIGFYLFTSVFTIFTAGNAGIAGLALSIITGSLTAGFVYLLANEINKTSTRNFALFAGLITAFSPILVKQSIVIMSDSLGLMLAAWSMWQFVRYFNHIKLKNIIFSFTLLSLALMTRYAFALIAAPVFAYLIYNIAVRKTLRLKFLKHTFFALIIGLIVFAPQLYYLLTYGVSYFQYEGEHGTWATGWSTANFLKKDFMTFDGTMHYKLWNGLYYLSPVFHPVYLLIFGFPFLAGLYLLIKKKQTGVLLLLLSWIASYYVYLSGNPFQSLRYTLSFLPAMAIISAYGLAETKIKSSYKNIFLYAGLAFFIGYGVYHINNFAEQKNSELETVEAVKKYVPTGSTVFTFDITLAVNHYTDIKAEELFNNSKEEIISKIDTSAGSIYLILPVESIKTQWTGLPLESKYEFIRTRYPIQTVTKINRFTIYKIPHSK